MILTDKTNIFRLIKIENLKKTVKKTDTLNTENVGERKHRAYKSHTKF